MSATVAFTAASIGAVDRGIRAISAEKELLERHGMVSVELETDLDELVELRDRMRAEREARLPVARLAVVR